MGKSIMRKLVINTGFRYGYVYDDSNIRKMTWEEELDVIAQAGFDGVFTAWRQGKMQPLAERVKDLGLYYQSIHAPAGNMEAFWSESADGEAITKRGIDCLRECAEIGVPLVIMHANPGSSGFSPLQIGVDRFGEIVKEAEKLGSIIALENVRDTQFLDVLFDAFDTNKNVKFCIDTGHANAYTPDVDVLGKYGEKLICTHLNDNFGKHATEPPFNRDDAHMLPFDGTVDWEKTVQYMKERNYQGDITLEVVHHSKRGKNTHDIYKEMSCLEYLQLALQKAEIFRAKLNENK